MGTMLCNMEFQVPLELLVEEIKNFTFRKGLRELRESDFFFVT